MTNKDIAKKAFEEVESEKNEKEVKVLKKQIQRVLEVTELKKKQKALIEEELRILKEDLDDLKNGDIKAIKERQDKSPIAKNVSPVEIVIINQPIYKEIINNNPGYYHGTYNVEPVFATSGTTTWATSNTSGASGDGTGNYLFASMNEMINKYL